MLIQDKIQKKIDLKTKPIGSLGMLENIAHQISTIQNTLSPKLTNPAMVIFAGDHGIANDGVSAYPQEVTYQMVYNFLQGGAAINVFSKQHGFDVYIVDAGVNHNFDENLNLINEKIGLGTKSFLTEKAMSKEDFKACVYAGRKITKSIAKKGTNIICFGEMGIGNTSASSMLMSYLCKLEIEDCVGRGTGVDEKQLKQKIDILQKAKIKHGELEDVEEILSSFGGFEMVQMYGAMLEAFDQKMLILVDGFIATSVFKAATKFSPEIIQNAIFCHQSDEKGHQLLLSNLGVKPILNLGLRLGEGTGCALAYPIIESAVKFLNEMASFESAGVSEKS